MKLVITSIGAGVPMLECSCVTVEVALEQFNTIQSIPGFIVKILDVDGLTILWKIGR